MNRDAYNYEAVSPTTTRHKADKCRLLLLAGLTVIVSILIVALCIHVSQRHGIGKLLNSVFRQNLFRCFGLDRIKQILY